MVTFAARAIAGDMSADEITAEATAQIRKIQSAGIAVSHIDTHKHTHLFPRILRPLLRAAAIAEFAPCAIRLARAFPCDRAISWPGPISGRAMPRFEFWVRFAGKFREAVDREGFTTPDGTLGIVVTGALDETLFYAIARSIPEGTWEFVCHPGYNDADLQQGKTRLRESRETELRVLTLPAARDVLARAGDRADLVSRSVGEPGSR